MGEGRELGFLGGVLSREQIRDLLRGEPPLVAGMPDPDNQVQPNGIDLTVDSVARFSDAGAVTVDNVHRRLPATEPVSLDRSGCWVLAPGAYLVRFSETVNLPSACMAYARPRSSLLRCGAALHTAVWDAGYSGQGVALLVVYNPAGFVLERQARIVQLVFHWLSEPTGEGYRGVYQGESGRTTG
jgi:dUTP pyrophosphatase